MAEYYGTSSTDFFVGTNNTADDFIFEPGELTSADTVVGGSGASIDPDHRDFIFLYNFAGDLASSAFSNVTGVEWIVVDGASAGAMGTITLDRDMLATADSRFTVIGKSCLGCRHPATPDPHEGPSSMGAGYTFQVANNSTVDVTLLGSGLHDTLIGATGDDVLNHFDEFNNDDIFLYADDDVLDGRAGNDTLYIGLGNDTALGGAGNDTIRVAIEEFDLDDSIDGGTGTDTLLFTTAGTALVGGFGTHVGIDTVLLANGDNTVVIGNDLATSTDAHNLLVLGGSGDDVINAGLVGTNTAHVTLRGGDGDDLITGGDGDDLLDGDEDNDTLNGGEGNDTLYGEGGDDVLNGGDGDDLITGGDGADILKGDADNDTLYGYDGDDTLEGGSGNDKLYGGENNDTLIGGAGADTLNGGSGSNWASYADSLLAPVTVSLLTGDASGGTATGDILFSIENLIGGNESDILEGDDGANSLIGGGGDDTLIGLGGTDVLEGEGGDDWLIPGLGGGTVTGGNGHDTVDYSGFSFNLAIDLTLAADQATLIDATYPPIIPGGPPLVLTVTQQLTGIEDVLTGAGGDDVKGNGADNLIDTGAGDDVLRGGSGADTLLAGEGNDRLRGGGGDDILDGGTDSAEDSDTADYANATNALDIDLERTADHAVGGSEVGTDQLIEIENIIGGSGADVISGDGEENILIGHDGADTLDGRAGSDTIDGGGGADDIEGRGGSDTITGGAGNDTLYGGSGNDLFDFSGGGTWDDDVITDFEDGTDHIGLQGRGYAFADLTVVAVGADTQVSADDGTILLQGIAPADITAADFFF